MATITETDAVPLVKNDSPSIGTSTASTSTRKDLMNLSRAIHLASLAYWERKKKLSH